MRILFDSKLSQFKTPFGTLKKQENCTLHILIPCSCRTTAVCLVLQAENGTELRRVPFAKQSDDTLYDTWGGERIGSYEKNDWILRSGLREVRCLPCHIAL